MTVKGVLSRREAYLTQHEINLEQSIFELEADFKIVNSIAKRFSTGELRLSQSQRRFLFHNLSSLNVTLVARRCGVCAGAIFSSDSGELNAGYGASDPKVEPTLEEMMPALRAEHDALVAAVEAALNNADLLIANGRDDLGPV